MIEIMVALSILATGYLAYLQLNGRILKSQLLSRQTLEASLLCANKLEELKSDYSLTRLETGTQQIRQTTTNYTLNWSIQSQAESFTLKTQISWDSPQGRQQFNASTELSPYQLIRQNLGNSLPVVMLQ